MPPNVDDVDDFLTRLLARPRPDPRDLLDEFKEHQYFREPADMFAALHEACAELSRQRLDPSEDPFSGYRYGETTGVLAGDALQDAFTTWSNHLHELYGLHGDSIRSQIARVSRTKRHAPPRAVAGPRGADRAPSGGRGGPMIAAVDARKSTEQGRAARL